MNATPKAPTISTALLKRAWDRATTTGYPAFIIADPDLHAPYISDEPFTYKDGEILLAYITSDGTITNRALTKTRSTP